MRRNPVLVSILIAMAIILAVFAVYIWRTADTSTYYEYATYADLKKDSSVRAATVPEFVPSSAKQIVGEYNVEFDTQELEFAFDPGDAVAVTRSFQKIVASEAHEIAEELRKFRWKRDFPEASHLAVFARHTPGMVEYLVIDATGMYAYYAAKRS